MSRYTIKLDGNPEGEVDSKEELGMALRDIVNNTEGFLSGDSDDGSHAVIEIERVGEN